MHGPCHLARSWRPDVKLLHGHDVAKLQIELLLGWQLTLHWKTQG